MQLTIKINLDNAAYENVGAELGDNLQAIIDRIGQGVSAGIVRDINGNKTGFFEIEAD